MGRYPPVQRVTPRLVRFFGFGLPSAKMLTLLPRAADLFREQITLGLDGDPKRAPDARLKPSADGRFPPCAGK